MKTQIIRTPALLAALAALAFTPAQILASETAARISSEVAEAKGDVAKAALQELDQEIDRVDALLDNAPTEADKTAAKARLEVLKERRSELRKTYVKARYDELRADVRAEAERAGAWAKRTFTRDSADKAADEVKDTVAEAKTAASRAGDKAYAQANTTGAAADITIYKLRPTDTNKEEAKAALKALEDKIDEMEDRIDALPAGAEREAAKRRLDALEDRKDALEREFNKARFDALIDDVKGTWHDLFN